MKSNKQEKDILYFLEFKKARKLQINQQYVKVLDCSTSIDN